MKVAGSHEFRSSRSDVWKALQDPAILATTLPGARSLEVVGPDRYKITADFGVGSVKSVYDGTFSIEDKQEPESCVLRGSARGAGGSIEVVAHSRLSDNGAGTVLTYEADARLTGPIAGVGQRMIAAASKRMSGQFFGAIDRTLIEGPVAVEAFAAEAAAQPVEGRVYAGRAPAPADNRSFILGMLVGFALALIGVAVGRRTAR